MFVGVVYGWAMKEDVDISGEGLVYGYETLMASMIRVQLCAKKCSYIVVREGPAIA